MTLKALRFPLLISRYMEERLIPSIEHTSLTLRSIGWISSDIGFNFLWLSGFPLKTFVCIVFLMTTAKPLRLSVTLPTAQIPFPALKWAKLITETEYPYQAISYEIKGDSQARFTFNEIATALSGVISPIRALTVREIELYGDFELILENLEPKKVLDFINRFGVVGVSDYSRREKFSRPMTRDKGELTAEQFMSLVGIIDRKEQAKTQAYFKKNPDVLRKKAMRFRWGTEVPLSWIENDLRDLYRCIRILEILKEKDTFEFNLNQSPELRRLISASDQAPFEIPYRKDSGTYKPTDTKWNLSQGQRESLVNTFVTNINRFLQPITRQPLQTQTQRETNEQAFGIEPFLIYSIMTTEGGFKGAFCKWESCKIFFYRQRITKEYCSDSCAGAGRQKRYRAKKQISVQKGRKKKASTKKKGNNA